MEGSRGHEVGEAPAPAPARPPSGTREAETGADARAAAVPAGRAGRGVSREEKLLPGL